MQTYMTHDPTEALRLYKECMSGHDGLIVHIADSVFVETGAYDSLDRAECDRLGIPVAQADYLGGSIVCMPGDLSLCRITWGNDDWAKDIANLSTAWLSGKGLTVTRDHNDILIDGKKVVSWARATNISGWCMSVVHYSIGPMDANLVDQICRKTMIKTPGSLGEYGINATDVLKAILPDIERS